MTSNALTRRASAWTVVTVALLTAGCGTGSSPPRAASPAPPASAASSPSTPEVSAGDQICSESDDVVTVAYREIAGVDPNLTSVDVHPVEGACSAPVVMWVHGGGYRTGDKARQIQDKARLFHDNGWILVSVNYRLTAPGQPGSAQFPDHFEDVAASIAWVHDSIAAYGGDPSRIALLGHSAGADIVSNVATNPVYLGEFGLEPQDLRCAGPLDTEGFDKAAAGADEPDGETAQWSEALGNNPDYVAGTSATLLIGSDVGIPPMIGVVRGTARRQGIETAFLDALETAGIEATTIDARSLSHQQVNTSIGAPGDVVMTPPLVDFLTGCLAA